MEHLRPTATARLVLDPPGRRDTKWWAVLMADEGFYLLYKRWLPRHPASWERNSPGGWTKVIDLTRRVRGQVPEPRLVWFPLELVPSNWGPHISVILGEEPRRNQDLWDLRARITRLESRKLSKRERRELDRLYQKWDHRTRRLRVPRALHGRPVRFEYDPESLNRSRKGRWCLHAFTEAAAELRTFFGLSPEVPWHSAPLHLTVGKEQGRGGTVR